MEESATILVVDDDENIRDVLKHTLEPRGYKVVTAHDGPTALALMPELRPALIVLDINMPRMNGFEVVSRIKRTPETKHTPIVIFTALRSLASPSVHINGVARFLIKGEERLSEVANAIEELLQQPGRPKQIGAVQDHDKGDVSLPDDAKPFALKINPSKQTLRHAQEKQPEKHQPKPPDAVRKKLAEIEAFEVASEAEDAAIEEVLNADNTEVKPTPVDLKGLKHVKSKPAETKPDARDTKPGAQSLGVDKTETS